MKKIFALVLTAFFASPILAQEGEVIAPEVRDIKLGKVEAFTRVMKLNVDKCMEVLNIYPDLKHYAHCRVELGLLKPTELVYDDNDYSAATMLNVPGGTQFKIEVDWGFVNDYPNRYGYTFSVSKSVNGVNADITREDVVFAFNYYSSANNGEVKAILSKIVR